MTIKKLIISGTFAAGALGFLPLIALAEGPTTQPSSERTADQIIAEYKSAMPQVDRERIQSDAAYREEYMKLAQAAQKKQADLAHEMLEKFPDHPGALSLISSVWMRQSRTDRAGVLKEMDEFIAQAKDGKSKDRVRFMRAAVTIQGEGDNKAKLDAVNQYIAEVPDDKVGAGNLLAGYAESLGDTEEAKAVMKRVIEEYPDSAAAKQAQAEQKLAAMQGKPFALSFNDAISGKAIDIKDLKGKVVVVDFWATWCGPCVGEMPHMKELYAKFKDQGVEFVGVSLDQSEEEGGLKALKEFVAKHEIAWPQYYQGKGWAGEFTSSLGINSIPRIFVIDADGNLFSTQGRGNLEKMIPELIEKRNSAKTTG